MKIPSLAIQETNMFSLVYAGTYSRGMDKNKGKGKLKTVGGDRNWTMGKGSMVIRQCIREV